MSQKNITQIPQKQQPNNRGKWILKPQEQEGDYHFSGTFYVTSGANEILSTLDIIHIKAKILQEVKKRQGMDYLQVFIRKSDKQQLFFIDQLSKAQLESGDYSADDHYCTLMLASEY